MPKTQSWTLAIEVKEPIGKWEFKNWIKAIGQAGNYPNCIVSDARAGPENAGAYGQDPLISAWSHDSRIEKRAVNMSDLFWLTDAQMARLEPFFPNGSLSDELLNEEMCDSLEDARRKPALWRYNDNTIRPHSSLAKKPSAEARRTPHQFEGSAPDALAQTNDEEYENQTRKLSL